MTAARQRRSKSVTRSRRSTRASLNSWTRAAIASQDASERSGREISPLEILATGGSTASQSRRRRSRGTRTSKPRETGSGGRSESTSKRSKPEIALTAALASSALPAHVEEHRFHATRKWRFDFAWPDQKVALEVEGGVFSGGRHVRGVGFKKDCEKYNAAVVDGWRVLRYVPGKGWIEDALSALEELLCR